MNTHWQVAGRRGGLSTDVSSQLGAFGFKFFDLFNFFAKMDNKPQFVSTFIELYRSFACLWKVKNDCYHNKRLKDEAYNKLVEYYQTAIPSATIDNVKRKINNLRSTFRKELKKVKKQKSGSSADDNYVSSLWYFDLLMFTADQEMPRNSISSESIVDNDQNETFCEDDDSLLASNSPLSSHSSLPSHSPLPSHSSSTQLRETSPSVLSTKSSANKRKRTLINEAYKALKEDDEYDGIGLNVACKLRRMNEDQKLYAELLINKVILYGIKQRLQEETNLTGLVPIQSQTAYSVPSSQLSQAARTDSLSRTSNTERTISIPIENDQQPLQTVVINTNDLNESDDMSQYIFYKTLE